MVLHIHLDASYLSDTKVKSRYGGHYFLSEKPVNPTNPLTGQPTNNGAINSKCSIQRIFLSSSDESEFISTVTMRTNLEEMGHPQPPKPIQTDNYTSHGIINSSILQRRSRAMDMRLYWVIDSVEQKQLLVYWALGSEKLGDYHTKHHPPTHHQTMKPQFLINAISSTDILRGCIDLPSFHLLSPTLYGLIIR